MRNIAKKGNITLIIYSKNRAMQLDCLLRSIKKNASFFDDIRVIYKATGVVYENAYNGVTGAKKIAEHNLREDTLKIIENCGRDYICFMCDDDIVFKRVSRIPKLEDFEVFSLRLGKNIIPKLHFSYPLSLDGHIFNTDEILSVTTKIEFDNPNKFEVKMVSYSGAFKTLYHIQYLVGIPHNRVSDRSGCAFTNKHTAEDLNNKFFERKIIDFEKMDFSHITNVHADIDYAFKSK